MWGALPHPTQPHSFDVQLHAITNNAHGVSEVSGHDSTLGLDKVWTQNPLNRWQFNSKEADLSLGMCGEVEDPFLPWVLWLCLCPWQQGEEITRERCLAGIHGGLSWLKSRFVWMWGKPGGSVCRCLLSRPVFQREDYPGAETPHAQRETPHFPSPFIFPLGTSCTTRREQLKNLSGVPVNTTQPSGPQIPAAKPHLWGGCPDCSRWLCWGCLLCVCLPVMLSVIMDCFILLGR